MDSVRQYLFTLIGAALICGIIGALVNKSTLSGGLIKLLCGIFVTICVISPIIDLDFSDFEQYITAFSIDSAMVSDSGYALADDTLRQSIKEQTESYILDKAASMKTELSVEVTLSDDDIPTPSRVVLSGDISPYVKSKISELLTDDLGIPKENQVWMR